MLARLGFTRIRCLARRDRLRPEPVDAAAPARFFRENELTRAEGV
jgi:hypothetical protein